MNNDFGTQVYQQAQALAEQGKDPNQTAKILSDKDPSGRNYGIGIVLMGDGKPMGTASTLLEYTARELEVSSVATYMNSEKIQMDLKKEVLAWQRIPEALSTHFTLGLPSDAGTGAVQTAVELGFMLNPSLHTLGVEELGWPAYKAMAKAARVNFKEFPIDTPIATAGVLPLYQSGPMNTTGLVKDQQANIERAKAAAAGCGCLILDRAYTGFEFASALKGQSYDEVMRRSYERQVKPFIDAGVTFCMAVSPTKAFASFALRPCGMLLVFTPDAGKGKEVNAAVNMLIRARGSSFEHVTTRAFAKAFAKERVRLEGEHIKVLERIAEAESMWRKHAKGSPIEYLFTEQYAGLFRNPEAEKGSPVKIYNEHLYPVFSGSRCRMNITGIPGDDALAGKHVRVFAAHCK